MGCLGGDRAPGGSHLADDVDVLLTHPLHVRELIEQVLESRGAEHHGDQIRGVRLIGGDKLAGEHALGAGLERLELRQPHPGGAQLAAELGQLGTLGVEVGLDTGQPAAERRDARVELADPGRA